jgi:hypothetical protein
MITRDQCLDMYRLHEEGVRNSEIARLHGIDHSTVWTIVTGRAHKELYDAVQRGEVEVPKRTSRPRVDSVRAKRRLAKEQERAEAVDRVVRAARIVARDHDRASLNVLKNALIRLDVLEPLETRLGATAEPRPGEKITVLEEGRPTRGRGRPAVTRPSVATV